MRPFDVVKINNTEYIVLTSEIVADEAIKPEKFYGFGLTTFTFSEQCVLIELNGAESSTPTIINPIDTHDICEINEKATAVYKALAGYRFGLVDLVWYGLASVGCVAAPTRFVPRDIPAAFLAAVL